MVRCPHHRARFDLGDVDSLSEHSGSGAVLSAKDVPGIDCYGVIPRFADQPVFAHCEARFRGEAVAAIVGETDAIEALDLAEFPVRWEELPPLRTIEEALTAMLARIHAHREGNILVRGRVVRGDVEKAMADADVVVGVSTKLDSWSTRTSSRKPALRGVLAIRSRSRRARSLRTWIAPTLPRSWGSRRNKCELFPQLLAADSDRSSIFRCSRLWRWRHGSWGVRAHGVFAHRVDCVDDEAASGTHATAGRGQPRRQTDRARFCRRLQYWRVLFVGPDCGRTSSCACIGTIFQFRTIGR